MAVLDDAREAWNEGADAYIEFVESGADYYRLLLHGPALLAACGEVRNASALDLGCGQGYFSRLLARAGARVTGVELSDKLVARARELEAAEPLCESRGAAAATAQRLRGAPLPVRPSIEL